MSIDYSTLSVQELNSVIAEAQSAIETKAEQEKEEVRGELTALAQSRGYTIEDLFPSSGKGKKKAKLPATHRDPNNPANTWTGRGRKPKWMIEALEADASVEDFKV